MIAQIREDFVRQGSSWLQHALVTLLGLQLLRVLFVGFVGYLRDSVGYGSLELAPVAVGIFALSLLAGPLNRLLGTNRTLWLAAGGVAIMRLVEQLIFNPTVDLYLSALGVVLFLMYIPLAVGIARTRGAGAGANLGLAFLLGVTLDNAIFLAGKTLDLSWQPGFLALGVVLMLAGALLWTLSRRSDETAAADGNWGANLALFALGPWLVLQMIVFQSTGMVASLTGWGLPATGTLLLLANAFGLYSAAGINKKGRGIGNALLHGVLITLALVPGNMQGSSWSWLWLFIGNVLSFRLAALLFNRAASTQGNPGLLRSSLLSGLGSILFVLIIFLYYASYDISLGVRSGLLLVIVGGLLTLLALLAFAGGRSSTQSLSRSPAIVAVLLLAIPLILVVSWKMPVMESVSPSEVRVVNYNLHNAANTAGALDPEALAQFIESQDADIVGLQEVSRGWLIWGGMDMLSWLSQRLEMDFVWGPTADAQWGNAVFSRYPITDSELYALPDEELLLQRGMIVALVDIGAAPLTIIDTHFTHVDEHDAQRLVQASAVLDIWGGDERTIFMGDLNARPDSEAIQLLIDSGLVDISREIGKQPVYTYSSTEPDHQIDYIFVSPDLGYRDFVIPATTASDHLPLVVTILLQE